MISRLSEEAYACESMSGWWEVWVTDFLTKDRGILKRAIDQVSDLRAVWKVLWMKEIWVSKKLFFFFKV